MTEEQFKERTRKLALRVIALVESLGRTGTAGVIGRQVVRSGTSIGANYRAACRAKSRADIAAKLAIVEEEADETVYWLELLVESGIVSGKRLQPLIDETNEILAMTVASIKTLKRGLLTESKRLVNLKSKI
ncbi:MAG: four helix bundle protein [Candidatus Hydrogenedentes bacterium]|nr:four helix bundle protein [Candidatus Hydrogenedentota bacterium]